ncbi:MAG: outer membrane protein assembly factor BamE [Alphaproteobacteria bacterium]|nr:outer membrane protein assembly factor BamE [Alphaproteobacteria bacterium]
MTSSSGRKVALGAALAIAAVSAAGCEATVNNRGYLPTPGLTEAIRVGVDTKSTLQAALGSPSTIGTFNDNTWYYISSKQEDFLFFYPEEVEREIVAVKFGPDQTVASVQRLGLEDGVQVAFSDRETPARGRELTFLQQIFGNVGRGSPISPNDESQDPRNRR